MPSPLSTIRNDRGPLVATPRDTVTLTKDYFVFESDFREIPSSESEDLWEFFLKYALGEPTPTPVGDAPNQRGISCRGGVWHVNLWAAGAANGTFPPDIPDFSSYAGFTVTSHNAVGTTIWTTAEHREQWDDITPNWPQLGCAITGMVVVPDGGDIGAQVANFSSHDTTFQIILSGHWISDAEAPEPE